METVLGFVLVIDACPGLVVCDVGPHLRPEIYSLAVQVGLEQGVVEAVAGESKGLFLVVVMQAWRQGIQHLSATVAP